MLRNALIFYNNEFSEDLNEEKIILSAIAKEKQKIALEKHAKKKPKKQNPKKCVCILSKTKSFNHNNSPYPTDSYIEKVILKVARKEKFPEDILWSIVSAESDFRESAVSSEGAVGPAQVTEIAARQLNMDFSPARYDLQYNLTLAVKYMKYLRRNYVDRDWPRLTDDDRWRMTTYYYNLGPHGAYNRLRYLGFTKDNLTRFNHICSGHVLGYESHILLSRFNERLSYIRVVLPDGETPPDKVRVACLK